MRPDAAPQSLQPIHHLMRILPPLGDERGLDFKSPEMQFVDPLCSLFEMSKIERNTDVTMRNFDCPTK
jgi:hypothetical protein